MMQFDYTDFLKHQIRFKKIVICQANLNMNVPAIRTAQSSARGPRQAAAEFHAAVAQPKMELVLFFCSSLYDLDVLADEMNRLFVGLQVIGCTTSGEIGPLGYCTNGISGASFSTLGFVGVSGLLKDLTRFSISAGHDFAQNQLQRLESRAPDVLAKQCFALLLIDGLSVREEPVAHAIQHALGDIALFGGSAGDDTKFSRTLVFSDGQFHADSAVLALFNTSLPFKIFKTQHFISTAVRLVVTQADTTHRVVKEINGLPAAAEYARLLGIGVHELNPMRFAASPVVVMIDGTDYVRSIQKVNPDGSLTFFCAIEEGLVLRVAHGVGLVNNLAQAFESLRKEIGRPQLVIACDCVLRKLEVSQNGLDDQVAEIFKCHNTVGFNGYGEQFHGVHVNQTFTGIAIGSAGNDADA